MISEDNQIGNYGLEPVVSKNIYCLSNSISEGRIGTLW